MELLILAHFQEASEFRNFVSLVDQELPMFLFFRETEGLQFFKEPVYINYLKLISDFFESGILIEGEREGFWTFWHGTGEKYSEGSYRDRKQEGLWRYWYNNGEKMFKGSYRNGKKEGPWKEWLENGEKWSERFYRNGRLIK